MKDSTMKRGLNTAAVLMTAAVLYMLVMVQPAFAEAQGDRVIAHGGGAYLGYETTNSKEAVENAIAQGYKYIELDMEFSSDGKIVMIHDWDRTLEHYFGTKFEKPLSASQFSNVQVHGQFTTLNFEELAKILDQTNKDQPEEEWVRIVTDTKGDNLKLLSEITKKYPAAMKYLVPQMYQYDEYQPIRDLGYETIIFTLYAMEKPDYTYLVNYVKQRDIWAVAVGEGYVYKNLEQLLPKEGIRVYFHPVATYEQAQSLLNKGVYGVYSGTLQPTDLDGSQPRYLLQQSGKSRAKLTDAQLADCSERAITSIPMEGMKAGEVAEYLLDEKPMNADRFQNLEDGKHSLSIAIKKAKDGSALQTLDYVIWKEKDRLRILDERYGYRLDVLKPLPSFEERVKIITSGSAITEEQEEVLDLLRGSLVAKKGEYFWYDKGKLKLFRLNQDLLYAESYSNGKILISLANVADSVGLDSLTMGNGRYIYMSKDGEKIITQASTYCMNKGGMLIQLKTPVTIQRRKTMVSGEFLSLVTGRAVLEDGEVMLLLPDKEKPGKNQEKLLLETARKLYL